MNKLFTKRFWVLISSLLFVSSTSFSQFKNVDFLRGGAKDGVTYIQKYIEPWTNAFGAGLNGGWYNTAKPHKLGGFDITTSFNVGIVPSSAATFDVTQIGLTTFKPPTGTGPFIASTIAGPNSSGPLMTYKDNVSGVTLASFNTPAGTGWKYIPVPALQVGIGLPFGTEIKGRFIPKIDIKDGDISLWGIGLLHSLIQYLPGNKLLPFDVSLFGGYTKLEGNVPLNLKPDATVLQVYTSPYNTPGAFDGQNLNISVEALNVSAIASLNLPVITFYGGLGYTKTKTGLELSGNFPTPGLVLTPVPHVEYNNTGVKKGSDFTNMDIKNFSGLRANIGFRVKLAVITIHADYTKAQYNVLSTGLGISFR
jgi:hypothetical protein